MKRHHKFKFSHRSITCAHGARGFSLLEVMIVICLIMIVGGMTFMAMQPALKDARANQAFEDTLMQLRTARQRAITERKQYIVCFGIAAPAGALTPKGAPGAQSIQMYRWDQGTALSAAVPPCKAGATAVAPATSGALAPCAGASKPAAIRPEL